LAVDVLRSDRVRGGEATVSRAAKVRWCAIATLAVVVAVWPSDGGASHGGGWPGTRGADRPTRRDAVAVAAPRSPAVAAATVDVAHARVAVAQLQQQLAGLRVTAFRHDTEVLPAAAADGLARTRAQRYADDAAGALMTRVDDAQHALDAAEEAQRRAVADYFAALAAAAEAEAEARRAAEAEALRQSTASAASAASTASAASSVASSTGSCAGSISCFLACTRAHESDTAGGYQALSPDGIYRGAYQFDQTTWNSVATSIGRGDLSGVNPAAANPADQDLLATALYEMRGNQPWGGRC
jgi:hypothetical protein